MSKHNIVIIGAGFAGASTAYFLSQLGETNIAILEMEEMPGIHSSGQNASLGRHLEEDPIIMEMTAAGGKFLSAPPAGFSEVPLIRQCGSYILSSKNDTKHDFKKALDHPMARTLTAKVIDKAVAIARIPFLQDAAFDEVLFTPEDGEMDIHSLLWAYIKGALHTGAKFVPNCKVSSIKKSGAGFEIKTTAGDFIADTVVNASGAWFGEISHASGGADIPIRTLRRHLYSTPVMKDVDPNWPFVWDVTHGWYFRPESGGLLLGPGDEEEIKPSFPSTNPETINMLAEKLADYCPRLAEVQISRQWAGIRTFAPDRKFLIGRDTRESGLFLVGALGGFGVTASPSIGRLAAENILGRSKENPNFTPARFIK